MLEYNENYNYIFWGDSMYINSYAEEGEYERIKLIVEDLKRKYNFKGLWHFTDFSNLQSIFKEGELSSRQACKDKKIKFLDGANQEIISQASDIIHSCTRFYYRPQTPTLYVNEGIKQIGFCGEVHIPIPVYLLFSENLIYDSNTYFSNGNATNSELGDDADFFAEMDWRAVFHNTSFTPEERDYIINKRQSELLSLIPVSLEKYLVAVYFRSNADLQRAIVKFGENKMFSVQTKYFSPKDNLTLADSRYNNYITDYRIEYSFNYIKIKIYLKKELQDYTLKWKITDSIGIPKNTLAGKEMSVNFINANNQILYRPNIKSTVTIEVTFNYKVAQGDTIYFYLNDCLSIEQPIYF